MIWAGYIIRLSSDLFGLSSIPIMTGRKKSWRGKVGFGGRFGARVNIDSGKLVEVLSSSSKANVTEHRIQVAMGVSDPHIAKQARQKLREDGYLSSGGNYLSPQRNLKADGYSPSPMFR